MSMSLEQIKHASTGGTDWDVYLDKRTSGIVKESTSIDDLMSRMIMDRHQYACGIQHIIEDVIYGECINNDYKPHIQCSVSQRILSPWQGIIQGKHHKYWVVVHAAGHAFEKHAINHLTIMGSLPNNAETVYSYHIGMVDADNKTQPAFMRMRVAVPVMHLSERALKNMTAAARRATQRSNQQYGTVHEPASSCKEDKEELLKYVKMRYFGLGKITSSYSFNDNDIFSKNTTHITTSHSTHLFDEYYYGVCTPEILYQSFPTRYSTEEDRQRWVFEMTLLGIPNERILSLITTYGFCNRQAASCSMTVDRDQESIFLNLGEHIISTHVEDDEDE